MTRRRNRRNREFENDDDDDNVNPNNGEFCRACVDMDELMTSKSSKSKTEPQSNCPLDKSALGRATWSVLHTLAAYYPVRPSSQEQAGMTRLVEEITHFYPCPHCKEDFQQEIAKSPPRVSSRSNLSQWLCEQHNIVNLKLGKPYFDCSQVDIRWRTGPSDGSCDPSNS